MIKYNEILDESRKPELSKDEIISLKKLEEITDEAIKNQFQMNYSIRLESNKVYSIINKFGIYRSPILIKNWTDLYKQNGWDIKHINDEIDYWSISGSK